MFDVPAAEKARLQWSGEVNHEARPWGVGLIVGPSGCGKTQLLRKLFGQPKQLRWDAKAVVDDFDARFGIAEVAEACQSVGFNTIPAWIRPFAVLSNGEQFRAQMGRLMLEANDDATIVVDEFTSVVDRQVAKIVSHAVQKHIRKGNKRFVAASCHYDIVDWLQPDWTLEPASMTFSWREVQRRPTIECRVERVPYSAWSLFARFHYLTAELSRSARCWALFIGDQPVAFAGMMTRPHPKTKNVIGCSRLVTLPDYQGMGLAFVLIDAVSSCYSALGFRVHTYPAHPALIRGFDKSRNWSMVKRPGLRERDPRNPIPFGGRPNAVFAYAGPPLASVELAARLTGRDKRHP